MRLPRHAPAVGAALAVAGLALYAHVARARFLLATPFPFGIDGYYYPIQVRELLERGHLYYPSAPLVFWLMAPLAALSDPVVGAKLLAAAGTALMVVPAYLIGKRLGGGRGPGVLSAALAATSAQSFYLSTEFVKQGVGSTLAVAFVAAAAAALERRTIARVAAALVLFAAAFLAHKTSFALALLLAAPPLLAALPGRRLVLAGSAAAVLGVGLFGARDLGLFRHLFRAQPTWSLPALWIPPGPALYFRHEVLIAALLAVAVLGVAAARRRLRDLPPLAVGFLVLALALALPWLDPTDDQGLVMRLRLTAFIALGPLAALLVAQLPALARSRLALAAAALLVVVLPAQRREATIDTHPALAASVQALGGVLPPGASVITPERHIAYMATWYARVPVRVSLPPAIDPGRTYRLLPGALIKPQLARALDELRKNPRPDVIPPRDLHGYAENGMVLVPEATFQYLLTRVDEATRRKYAEWWIQ